MAWQFERDAHRRWRWSYVDEDGVVEKRSAERFDLMRDCLQDARRNGCPAGDFAAPPARARAAGFVGSARGQSWSH
jgi:hypothetical protein